MNSYRDSHVDDASKTYYYCIYCTPQTDPEQLGMQMVGKGYVRLSCPKDHRLDDAYRAQLLEAGAWDGFVGWFILTLVFLPLLVGFATTGQIRLPVGFDPWRKDNNK